MYVVNLYAIDAQLGYWFQMFTALIGVLRISCMSLDIYTDVINVICFKYTISKT